MSLSFIDLDLEQVFVQFVVFGFQGTISGNLFDYLVEMVRFELMTPCLQGRCSPN